MRRASDGAIDWPATRNATDASDFNLPSSSRRTSAGSRRRPRAALGKSLGALGHPLAAPQKQWAHSPKRFFTRTVEVVGSVAAHVAWRHEPNLLLVHFSA